MHRIFKKKHDRAATSTEARARRPRRQRLAVEALEGRQLMAVGLNDFLVNEKTPGAQSFSDNASSANGMSVAVWNTDGFGDVDIHAQLYSASGLRVTPQESIIAASGSVEENPHVAMDANGNFVVAYEKIVNGQTDVIARRFSSSGSSLGETVVAHSTVNEHDADVAMDAKGNFVVSYTVDLNSTDKDIQAALFTSSGTRIGFVNDTHLNSGGFDETRSSVAMSPDGRFDIAYQLGFHGGGSERIHLARYSAAGVPQGDQQILTQQSPTRNPSVAMDNAGNAVVAYQTFNFGGTGRFANLFNIEAQRFNSAGANSGFTQITLSGNADPPVNNVLPSVALAATGGSYVVGYQASFSNGSRNVAVAEVNGSNTLVGALGLPTSPNYLAPALSIAGNGKYLFTFDAFDSGGADRNIHGRFGSLPVAPAAKNLALTSPSKAGQSATLTGQLTDAAGNKNLTLTVNWGDGSQPQQRHPGLKPFAVKHKYAQAGTYTVHVTWTGSTGLSNSRDLKVTVQAK